MTTLAITPNWKNKTAKFKGTVAAGEHVSVTIQNDNGEGEKVISDASTLRLRVVGMDGRTLAIFPEPVPEGETPETWGEEDLTPLTCTLNLNTVQMLKAVPPAANVPLLWVLDDYDNKTLYFKEQFEVTHWPRLRGEEEPIDLDDYKDIIADFNTRLDGYDSRITAAENVANAATENASTATATANQATATANQALDKAETAQNSAAASAEAASVAQVAAEAAQAAAEEAAESINSPDATLSEEGVAADAKATGDAIADEETRATAAEAAEEARAKGVEGGLRIDLTAAEKAIDDEAILRATADADLDANKADRSTTYTKAEVDAKVAGVQTFKKYLVQTLPDPDEADMKGLYLVPTGETSEEGDLCEEWTVVEDSGEKRWEKIGGTTVDLSDYYDKSAVDGLLSGKQDALTFDNAPTSGSANPVKSGGIWSAIWGALSALPVGFSSLYDWCVSQLAGKMPSNATGADIAVSGTDATKISAALAGKAPKSDVDPLLFAQYYPDGSVKSAAEFTSGIQYDAPDTDNRTITVKPFCNTGSVSDDNCLLSGRVVIPPFVDAQGNPYVSDDGTRFKVVGVSGGDNPVDSNTNLTAVAASNTVTTIGGYAFNHCTSLTSASFPAATTIRIGAFTNCTSLISISLPAATTIVGRAFTGCTKLDYVDFGDTPRPTVPTLVSGAFENAPAACKIIVPYTQYDEWIAADVWKDLPQEFVRHAEKADKPATFTEGNLAKFDANGNPVDSGKKPSDFQSALSDAQLANIAAVSDALAFDETHSYAAGDPVVYDGTLYTFTEAHTGAWTGSDVSEVDVTARLNGKLDKSGGTVTGDLEVVYDTYGFTVKDASGNYLQIQHGMVAGDFWYINYSVAGVGSGSLRLPYDNVIPANIYSLAGQFNESTTYAPNSLCIDDEHGVLYRCINPNGHTGAWVAADFAVATVEDVLAALRTGKADVSAIPYSLVAKTIDNGAVTLDDRASNAVTISATLSLNKLTINFPTAPTGKLRDFAMRLNIASGVTAPEIAWPHGVTIENDGGEVPEIADGGTGGSSTILYFSETENNGTTAKFLVKCETLTAIAQA